jgi:hypothetical protein
MNGLVTITGTLVAGPLFLVLPGGWFDFRENSLFIIWFREDRR